jgi:hypothetical protein
MISPALHSVPPSARVVRAFSPRGGTLASTPSAGHSSFPSRSFRWVPCSIQLSRDARSVRGQGHCVTANRAICMRTRREHQPWSVGRSRPLSSTIFDEAAHKLRAHNTDTNQAGWVLRSPVRKAGAGLPPAAQPRPPVFSHVDDLTQWNLSSRCSASSNSEHRRGSFHDAGRFIHARAG